MFILTHSRSIYVNVYTVLKYAKQATIIMLLCYTSSISAQIQFENTTSSLGGPYHTGESWGASWGHMDEDVYPDLFVNNHAMTTSLLRNNGNGTFSENALIADLEGIWSSEPYADIHGGAWADFDNDGDQDIFATRSSTGARFHLFENNGHGYFEEKGGPLGIGGNGGGRMPVLFDYTNDGRLDVMLTRNGGEGKIFKWDVTKFIEQTSQNGMSGECNRSFSGFASDLFNSGSLDIICLAETSIPYGAFNTGTIPFADISSSIDPIGTNSDSVLADFDNDLKMDLFVLRGLVRPSGVKKVSDQRIEAWMSVGGSTDFEKSITFSSTGPITVSVFARTVGTPSTTYIGATSYNPISTPVTLDPTDQSTWGQAPTHDIDERAVFIEYDEVAQEWTVSLSGGGVGSEGAYFIIDGNGFSSPTISGLKNVDLALEPRFLMNNGSSLVDSGSKGIGNIMCGGIAAADFDNDMDIDLYLACRTGVENIENRLYLNDGTGTFTYDTSNNGAAGLLGSGVDSGIGTAEMVITADYDLDGFIDLFVTNGNRLFPHFVSDGFTAGGSSEFYRNLGGNGNHWIHIDLQGVTTNRDGFGAKAIVTAGGVSQLREQNGQYHRWSHDHKRLHFGLASNTTADVTVEWPDGTSDVYTSVAADKLYRAVQGSASLVDITPDQSKPTLSVDNVSVSEGDNAILTVSLSAASSTPISVDYETIANTAKESIDFVAASGTLIFGPNETTKTVTINTLTNPELEANEIFVLSLFNSGDTLITQSSGIITIEEVGGVACGEPDYSPQSEKGLFIWRDCGNTDNWLFRGTAGGSQTIYLGDLIASDAISSLTTYSFEGSDFAVLSNFDEKLDFRLAMGNSGEDGFEFALPYGQELCLSLTDPNLDIFVGAEKIPFNSNVNLANVSSLCQPKLSISDITVSENVGNVDVTVSISNAYTDVVSATFATSDGSALAGFDYSSVTGNVDIATNSTSSVITIPIIQDSEVESLEDFSVILSNPVNASLLDDSAIVSIDDDEQTACGAPSYSSTVDAGIFVWQDCGGTEQWHVRATAGGGGQTVYLGSLEASNAFSSLLPVSFEGSDFAALSNSDKDIDFKMTMANAGVDGIDVNLQAGSELCLMLDDPNQVIYVGVDKIPFTSAVNLANITNVCAVGLPKLTVNDVTVSEAAGSVDVTVTLSEVSANIVSASYVTSDNTALNGFDYTSVSGTFNIQPNQTSTVITVPILQDSDVESLEDFTVTLSNPVAADILDDTAVISIDDDEQTACGAPSYSASTDAGLFVWQDCGGTEQWHVRATAGGGGQTVYLGSLEASNAFSSLLPVSFEGSDFATLSNSDKDIDFRMTMANAGVDGIDVDLQAGSELCLMLDDPNQVIYVGVDKIPFTSTVNLANVTSVCAVGLPKLSVNDVTVSEAAGSVDVTVTLSEVSANIVSASYVTSDNTALNGFDYLSVSGTFNIQPNQTSTVITVPILQDSIVESLEDFTVTLSNPVDADILDDTAVISIDDDEQTACGAPSYSSSTDAGIFVWQDCGGSEQWYVRATAGGGAAILYGGTIISDGPITAVTTFSFEGIDSYSLTNSNQDMSFFMKMAGSGVDGIQFTLQPGSSCLDIILPAGINAVVGEDNAIITPPFDLLSLNSC